MLRFIAAVDPEAAEIKRKAMNRVKSALASAVGITSDPSSEDIEVTGGPEIERVVTDTVAREAMAQDATGMVLTSSGNVVKDRPMETL